ncbi:MAG: TIGR02996 domain-containing protein [Myxococcales bacterium]|nr:TIGR02996 domain-containing protein [Myxococcales bacterium]
MTDREAELLEAIVRAPEDDTPRLIFADWLSEQGDPRGELIHLQLRAASLEAGGERNKVRAAENKLLDAHRAAWLGPIAGVVEKAEFRRGFVAMVRMTARAWIAHAKSVLAVAPLIDELELLFGEGEGGLGPEAFERRDAPRALVEPSRDHAEPVGRSPQRPPWARCGPSSSRAPPSRRPKAKRSRPRSSPSSERSA